MDSRTPNKVKETLSPYCKEKGLWSQRDTVCPSSPIISPF